MDSGGESYYLSQASTDLAVDGHDKDPGTHIPGPDLIKRNKPGRPPGSKNKPKTTIPYTEGLGLRDRTLFVPWNVVDVIDDSDSGKDEANGDVAAQDDVSEWEGDDSDSDNTSDSDTNSDSDNNSESKVISEQRDAYRKGVRHMTRLIEAKGPITKRIIENQRPFSSSPTHRRTTVWNQAREEGLKASWELSLEKAAIERHSTRVNGLLAAWKMSLQLFGVDPLTLISMYQHMDFDNSVSDSLEHYGEMERNPLWTHDFCKKLQRIMVHPLFANQNDHHFIPILIRWAVICRADDGYGFTEKEQQLLDDAHCGNLRPLDRSESILERFHNYQQEWKNNGRIMSIHARLMSRIVDHSRPDETKTCSGFARVKTRDLTIVVEALNSLDRYTTNTSCEVYFQIYSDSKASRGYPAGSCKLLEAYKTAWINLQRRRMSDYNQVLRVNTSTDRADGVATDVEAIEECTIDQDQSRVDATFDHGGKTVSEVNNPRRECDGYPCQVMTFGSSRSPSRSEDGEIPEEDEAPAITSTDDDHLHQSRRVLIRSHHIPEALALNGSPSLPDVIATQPCGSNTDLNHAAFKLSSSALGSEGEHTGIRAPETPIILPRIRDPYRDSIGSYDNGRHNDTTSEFLNVDGLFNRPNENTGTRNRPSTITQTTGASKGFSEPTLLPSRARKRGSNRSQTEGSRKRRNVHGPYHSRTQRSGRRNSTNERRSFHQPGRSQVSRLQPPAGPRAWLLEEKWRKK